ncbi:MAG: hypothetical protein IH820_01025 [Bacteroidetes bacterium]|nr:hypothetical protein [Bacteroidota bacterium]
MLNEFWTQIEDVLKYRRAIKPAVFLLTKLLIAADAKLAISGSQVW